MSQTVELEDDEVIVKEESLAAMADNIKIISSAVRKMREPGFINHDCIVALIAHKTKLSQGNIKAVLGTLEKLDNIFVNGEKSR